MSISLFLGAGASAQFSMDTTVDFKKKLMDDKQFNPATVPNQPQKPTLFSLLNNPKLKDIEHVLHAIKQLTENITAPSTFPEYAKLAWDELTYPTLPAFKSVFEQLSSTLISIQTQINNQVFNAYNWDTSNNAHLERFYTLLFQIIRKDSEIINIGTTNYDQAIETFCVLPNSKHSCHDGFDIREDLQSVFSQDNFNLDKTDIEKTDVKLFKIHGSLNWKQEGNNIYKIFGDKSSISSNNRVFISPTLNPKNGVKKEPFNSLYNLFNQHLQKSDICVILGYSFRDEHINEIFGKFLKNNEHQIIIISPSCKSNFVRNYCDKDCTTREMDEGWLKNNKPNNVHFMEYSIDKNNYTEVLTKLNDKISTNKTQSKEIVETKK